MDLFSWMPFLCQIRDIAAASKRHPKKWIAVYFIAVPRLMLGCLYHDFTGSVQMLCSGGLLPVHILDMPLIFQQPPMLLSDKAVGISVWRFDVLGFSHQHSGLQLLH